MSNSPAGRVPWPDSFDDASLSSSPERRKHARSKLPAATAVVLDSNSRPAIIVDLSEGGIGVRSDAVLEQGATCRVQLTVPDSNQVIDAACELAWKRAPHAGFRFILLTEKSQRQIKEWLKTSQASNGNGSPAAATAPMAPETAEKFEQPLAASDEALLNLAIKARDFIHADGVAVAVADGEGIVCRASLGSAPDVGVRIQTDRGLSGECLRTGEIVVCYDSDSDPRVDSAVARQLNMRSAVIVPIGRHEAPAGLLEVFFANARAFDEGGVDALQELASAFFVAAQKQPPAPKAETTPPSAGLPQMASFTLREAPPGFVICDVCGHQNNDSNHVCDRCDVPLPAALRYVDLNSPESGDRSGLRPEAAREEHTAVPAPGYRKKLFFMLLVALLVAAWQARGKISADTHIPNAPASGGANLQLQEAKPLPDKPVEPPMPDADRKEPAAKVARRVEPEVTIKNFSQPANQRRARAATSKAHSKALMSKTTPAGGTTPEAGVAPQVTSPAAEQALASEHPVVLPLDDQDVVSAVSTPPPVPAKPKQPSLWKRIGKKMIFKGGKADAEKKQ